MHSGNMHSAGTGFPAAFDSPVYEQCQKALVALMAYACQKERDSDFEEWVKKYEKTDETFSPSQKINYMFLKNNFDNYVKRGVTA